MKQSDLDPAALEAACKRTWEYEWVGSDWNRVAEKEKALFRSEIAGTIAAYLSATLMPSASTVVPS